MPGTVLSLFLLGLFVGGVALLAQAEGSPPAEGPSCENVRLQGRTIGVVRIVTPYDALHLSFLNSLLARSESDVRALLGPVYLQSQVDAATNLLEARDLASVPNLGIPIRASVVTLSAWNCRETEGSRTVDLEFFYFPARVPAFFGHNPETHTEEATDAAKPSGVAPRRFLFNPTLAYSETTRLLPGFSLAWQRPSPFLDSLSLRAARSSAVSSLAAAANGSAATNRTLLKLASYQVGFDHLDEPIASTRAVSSRGFINFTGASAPLGSLGLILRYGTALELERSSQSVPSTRDDVYGSLKAYSGLALRTAHQTFASSYAFQAAGLGSQSVAYHKHLVDLSHSLSWSPNHYPIEVDTRFSAGRIQDRCGADAACALPLADQFFGGNVERNFLRDASWVIRAQPFLRGVPFNSLNPVGQPGADRFWAANFTAAFAAWRIPLIPRALLDAPGFLARIDVLPVTATQLLAAEYANRDPAFFTDPGLEQARSLTVPIREQLLTARPLWDALPPTPPELAEARDICTEDQWDGLPLDLNDVDLNTRPVSLLANSSSHLAEVVKCIQRFAQPSDLSLLAAGTQLSALRQEIEAAITATGAYQRGLAQATRDMRIGARTVHTLFREANLVSVGLVVAFDVASLQAGSGAPSVRRESAGGGIRFTVVSTVRVTLGYSVNLQRQPTEGRGALFASFEILDVFGR